MQLLQPQHEVHQHATMQHLQLSVMTCTIWYHASALAHARANYGTMQEPLFEL